MRQTSSQGSVWKQRKQYNAYPFTVKSKQAYAFGGATNVKQFTEQQRQNSSSDNIIFNQNSQQYTSYNVPPSQSQQLNEIKGQIQSKKQNDYVARSKLTRTKSAIPGGVRGGGGGNVQHNNINNEEQSQKDGNKFKIYYPEEYFRRSGYEMKYQDYVNKMPPGHQGSASMQVDRFNEDIQYGAKNKNKDDQASVYSNSSKFKLRQEQMRAQSSYNKKRLAGVQDNNGGTIEQNLKEGDEVQSIITQDKLRRFNEINGIDMGGPVNENNENDQEDQFQYQEEEDDELKDEVHSMKDKELQVKLKYQEGGEKKSQGTKSIISRRTILSANGSVKTSKTYISKLEKQLTEEKYARQKLEKEIEEIRRMNSEISSKLGISLQK